MLTLMLVQMASSGLIDHNSIRIDDRCRNLYYRKYKFRAVFYDPAMYISYKNISKFFLSSDSKSQNAVLLDLSNKLAIWKCWTVANTADTKKLLSGNNYVLYTNDVTLIEKFVEITEIAPTSIIHRIVKRTYEKGVVYHKYPKKKFRLYFNFHRFSIDDQKDFMQFLDSNDFSPSDSLTRRLNSRRHSMFPLILYTSHFVDYDDEKLLTVLALTYNDTIRKVCRIEKG